MEGLKEFFNKILAKLKKLPRKRVALVTMCTMLTITAILTVVVAVEMAPLAGLLFYKPDSSDVNQNTQATDDAGVVDPTETTSPLATDPGHTHSFEIYIKTIKATCTESGYSLYLCACGEREEKDFVKANGHAFGAGRLVAATCEEQGYTEYICSVCRYVEQKNKTASLGGHDYRLTESFEPGCGTEGKDVYICQNCKEVKEEITAPALEHMYELIEEKEATCSEKGYKRYACTNEDCDDFYDEMIKKADHNYGSWEITQIPSAGNPGKETRECNACHEKETRVCQLEIKENYSSNAGDSKNYTVKIGPINEQYDSVTVYTYEITDKSGINLTFSYDQEKGLVIHFTGSDKTITLKPGSSSVSIDASGNLI